MKKFVILLFFSSLFSFHVVACLHASQNRLFPIGLCADGLVVLELHSVRGENVMPGSGHELIGEWGARTFLNIYAKNRKLKYSEILDSNIRIDEGKYLFEINKAFEKALWKGNQLAGFIPAEPVFITFCDYQLTCSLAQLKIDTLSYKAYIQLPEKQGIEVDVLNDSSSIASNYLERFSGFDYDSENERKLFLIQELLISSVRKYKIGETMVTLVHLGIGSDYSNEPAKEYATDIEFKLLENSVFEEPLLYHGHGFDFLIWE